MLYAKTQEALTLDCRYDIDGNVIAAKILDLNQEFSSIARQLDEAVEECNRQTSGRIKKAATSAARL